MKKENEYVMDGQRYLRDIRKCECLRSEGEEYYLECRIHQRGEHFYWYRMDSGLLRKAWSNTIRLALEEKAEDRIRAEIRRFEEQIRGFDAAGSVRVPLGEGKFTLFYRRVSVKTFDVRMEYLEKGILKRTQVLRNVTLRQMMASFPSKCDAYEFLEAKALLLFGGTDELSNGPLYQAALRTGDVLLEKQLIMEYGRFLSPRDASWISSKTGEQVLPSLPEEYDREYYVDADTIPAGALTGYRILHRPYFAMKDSTHGIFTLNPHTREGVDAASKGAPSIAFIDYMRLFASGEQPASVPQEELQKNAENPGESR